MEREGEREGGSSSNPTPTDMMSAVVSRNYFLEERGGKKVGVRKRKEAAPNKAIPVLGEIIANDGGKGLLINRIRISEGEKRGIFPRQKSRSPNDIRAAKCRRKDFPFEGPDFELPGELVQRRR